MTSFNFCSSFFGVTGVTSLEFLSSVHGATEVTSLKFRSFQFVWGVLGELAQIFSSLYGATEVTALAICSSLVFSYWSDLAFFPCHLQDLETLSSKVDTLQNQIATNSVEYALVTVRQFAGRPFPLIDNHSLLAALEQLADVARQTGHAERKRRTMPFFARANHFLGTSASLQWLRACLATPRKNRSPLKSRRP